MKREQTMRDRVGEAIRRHAQPVSGGCLENDRLIDFYSDRLDAAASAELREHLVACPACRERAQQARLFLTVMCEPISAQPARPAKLSWMPTRGAPFLMAMAATVVVGVVAILLWRTSGGEYPREQQALSSTPSDLQPGTPLTNPWRNLTVAKADYSPPVAGPDEMFYRNGKPAPPTGSTLPLAMEPYERNDFGEAARRLAKFLEKNPTAAEAHFYRGVSLLLLDRTSEAIAPLRAAIENGEGVLEDDARWYLAMAFLKSARYAEALEQLDSLSAAPGPRRLAAEGLRQEVRSNAQKSR